MNETHLDAAAPPLSLLATGDLLAWAGGGVVLLGERAIDRWIVARAWREDDRLSDVRRWSFAEPRGFAGQFRRLCLEATNDPATARAIGVAALAWTERT